MGRNRHEGGTCLILLAGVVAGSWVLARAGAPRHLAGRLLALTAGTVVLQREVPGGPRGVFLAPRPAVLL